MRHLWNYSDTTVRHKWHNEFCVVAARARTHTHTVSPSERQPNSQLSIRLAAVQLQKGAQRAVQVRLRGDLRVSPPHTSTHTAVKLISKILKRSGSTRSPRYDVSVCPVTNLRLANIHGLISPLKKHVVLELKRAWTRARGAARAQAEAEAEAAAVQPGQTAPDQRRVAPVKAHPHVDVAQRYEHVRLRTERPWWLLNWNQLGSITASTAEKLKLQLFFFGFSGR